MERYKTKIAEPDFIPWLHHPAWKEKVVPENDSSLPYSVWDSVSVEDLLRDEDSYDNIVASVIMTQENDLRDYFLHMLAGSAVLTYNQKLLIIDAVNGKPPSEREEMMTGLLDILTREKADVYRHYNIYFDLVNDPENKGQDILAMTDFLLENADKEDEGDSD